MGPRQTESSYLKSVPLWLQEYWTEPDPPLAIRLEPRKGRNTGPREGRSLTKSTTRHNRSARVLAPAKFIGIPSAKDCRTHTAMDYYFDHLKKTVASAPTGGTEFGEKVKGYAENNIAATQEFVMALSLEFDG